MLEENDWAPEDGQPGLTLAANPHESRLQKDNIISISCKRSTNHLVPAGMCLPRKMERPTLICTHGILMQQCILPTVPMLAQIKSCQTH